jgi:hypothetical protein
MSAGLLNIYVEAGDDWSRTISLTLNDTAIDLDTWSFEGGLQRNIGDGHVTDFTFTKLPDAGTLLISLDKTETALLNGEKNYYNWHATDATGKKIRLAEGWAIISREVK